MTHNQPIIIRGDSKSVSYPMSHARNEVIYSKAPSEHHGLNKMNRFPSGDQFQPMTVPAHSTDRQTHWNAVESHPADGQIRWETVHAPMPTMQHEFKTTYAHPTHTESRTATIHEHPMNAQHQSNIVHVRSVAFENEANTAHTRPLASKSQSETAYMPQTSKHFLTESMQTLTNVDTSQHTTVIDSTVIQKRQNETVFVPEIVGRSNPQPSRLRSAWVPKLLVGACISFLLIAAVLIPLLVSLLTPATTTTTTTTTTQGHHFLISAFAAVFWM
jgi:hypothetical protein